MAGQDQAGESSVAEGTFGFARMKAQIMFWLPMTWYILMAALIDGVVLVLFGAEDFLRQYTVIVNHWLVADFVIPTFQGWAIALTPILTGFFVGFIVEEKAQTESIKPYMYVSIAITSLAVAEVMAILMFPAILGWLSAADDFILGGVSLFLVMALLFFPLTFIGTFLGAIMVSY